MPVHFVSKCVEGSDQPGGFVLAVVLDIDDGLAAGDSGGCSFENFRFHPLDINFEKIATWQIETIKGNYLNRFALRISSSATPPKLWIACNREPAPWWFPGAAQGQLAHIHIGDVV